MKLRISMKTPDCVADALDAADLTEAQHTAAAKICERWFEYGEAVTIEVDLAIENATVVKL